MQAAIIQNGVGVGGRSKVIAEASRVLADALPVDAIDVFTLSATEEFQSFVDTYDVPNLVSHVPVDAGVQPPGTIYQQPYLNYRVRDRIQDYDVVFNSNNTMRFLPDGPQYIHYIHFPAEAIPQYDPKYAQPKYGVLGLPARLANRLAPETPPADSTVLTNSKYTAGVVADALDVAVDTVLYPPASDGDAPREVSGSGLVSLGSFHPNKRQLEQIQLADALGLPTRIIGSVAAPDYYHQCVEYVASNDVSNVELYPDASWETVERLLRQSLVFLHAKAREPFGISTVEGIAHGCIPVVPDSGGQPEIVTNPELRYDTLRDARGIIRDVTASQPPSPQLDARAVLERFSTTEFHSGLRDHLPT